MKTAWSQLLSWPPLPLTVVGIAILAGLAAFELAGGTGNLAASIPAALGALGALKIALPQQSAATIDEVTALATRILAASTGPGTDTLAGDSARAPTPAAPSSPSASAAQPVPQNF